MNFYTSIYIRYNTLKISHLYKIGQRQKDENGFKVSILMENRTYLHSYIYDYRLINQYFTLKCSII